MKTLTLTLFAACLAAPAADIDTFFRDIYDRAVRVSTKVEFPHLVSQQPAACAPFCPIPAPDPVTGRLNFGFNAAQTQIDDTFALF